MLDRLKQRLAGAQELCRKRGRPFVILTYAQSLDGSIAGRNRRQVRLSGAAAMTLTHHLRSCSDAILVGIGTVLNDNPELTTRLVEGHSPRPIILDTRLRTPLDARLLQRKDCACWIISHRESDGAKRESLVKAGAIVVPCQTALDGKIDLQSLMRILVTNEINILMVEGGARVITSFVGARLIDQFIITVAPKLIGGLNAIDDRGTGMEPFVPLVQVGYQQLGEDMILWAQPDWNSA
ncbi:MAG: RibD family protein [Deltaproteobacteria bacterium]|nr:RibD family protein [Deltaproteobacteria bacterium]